MMSKLQVRKSALIVLLMVGAAHAEIQEQECADATIDPTTPSVDFSEMEDGAVVRHDRTGLEWQRCALGQSWISIEARCDGAAEEFTWQEALETAYIEDGWRLPNIIELRSIVERCGYDPAINEKVFPDTSSSRFWSSSPEASYVDSAYHVNFESGDDIFRWLKSSNAMVRLVRDRQEVDD